MSSLVGTPRLSTGGGSTPGSGARRSPLSASNVVATELQSDPLQTRWVCRSRAGARAGQRGSFPTRLSASPSPGRRELLRDINRALNSPLPMTGVSAAAPPPAGGGGVYRVRASLQLPNLPTLPCCCRPHMYASWRRSLQRAARRAARRAMAAAAAAPLAVAAAERRCRPPSTLPKM